MIPVDQSEIGRDNPKANCLMACVASILEVPLASLPCVHAGEARGKHWYNTLLEAVAVLGYRPVEGGSREGFYIGVGTSPRSNNPHAVVMQGGVMVHDPHPTRGGLLSNDVEYWITLEELK